jgi:purine-binding chemotaxis protein CheW
MSGTKTGAPAIEAIESTDTVSLCSLHAGTGLFGIDTRQIREVLGKTAPQRVPLAPGYIAGVVPYRGEVLTTVSFRALLGLDVWPGVNCVLVLDDEENGERFGLMVDGVGGVVTMAADALEANPAGLDARSLALFDGAYRTSAGLMVRLEPGLLRPSRLGESGLFGNMKHDEMMHGGRKHGGSGYERHAEHK